MKSKWFTQGICHEDMQWAVLGKGSFDHQTQNKTYHPLYGVASAYAKCGMTMQVSWLWRYKEHVPLYTLFVQPAWDPDIVVEKTCFWQCWEIVHQSVIENACPICSTSPSHQPAFTFDQRLCEVLEKSLRKWCKLIRFYHDLINRHWVNSLAWKPYRVLWVRERVTVQELIWGFPPGLLTWACDRRLSGWHVSEVLLYNGRWVAGVIIHLQG